MRALVALALAVVGSVLIWAALAAPPAPEPLAAGPTVSSTAEAPVGPTVSPTAVAGTSRTSSPPANHPLVRDRTTGLVLPESDPLTVVIPRIGVGSRLVHLGLDRDGAMEVPQDPALAGWFSRSAAPGALGPAVIAGHVTWNRAPAVFRHLGRLRSGDAVSVTRKDGTTAVFTVERVASFSKSRFPSDKVYGTIDHAGLRLITCGGTYDTVRHRYLDNVVVFARLTQVREGRH